MGSFGMKCRWKMVAFDFIVPYFWMETFANINLMFF